MKVKTISIKIETFDEAMAYLNKIFVGTASNICYCKPSSESMQVITYQIEPGIIHFGTATLREYHNAKTNDVRYVLEDNTVKIENTIPTCVLDLLTTIKELIVPIFDQVAAKNVDTAIKSYMRLASPEIEMTDIKLHGPYARSLLYSIRHQAVRDWLAAKCRECHTAYLTDADGCGDKEDGLSWSYVCCDSGCPYTFLKEILRGDFDDDDEDEE